MPMDINSFGVGGEGLSGLFMGQQLAAQQQAAEADRQKTLADIANTQAITQQRSLGNQLEEQLLPDKVAAYRADQTNKADELKYAKFMRGSKAMGQLGTMLENVPAAARPAALSQMAGQIGITEDNPMFSHLMQADPQDLPQMLSDYSKKLYEQGDEARKAKQAQDSAMAISEMQRRSAEKIAGGNNATTIRAAEIAAASRENAANARGAAKGGALEKMSVDQRISYLETKGAVEGLSDGEQTALENLKRFKLGQATVGRPDTAGAMGMAPPQEQKIEDIIRGGSPTKPTGVVPQISSNEEYVKLPSGAKYKDPNGNIRTKK